MKKTQRYNIKHNTIALMAGIAALTSSCEHRELAHPENKNIYFYDCIGYCRPIEWLDAPTPAGPTVFHPYYDYSLLDKQHLTYIVNHPTTDTLYMTLMDESDYSNCLGDYYIATLRRKLQERCDISPRIRGRGNFDFPSGMASTDDSLALVKMGFTVNQR